MGTVESVQEAMASLHESLQNIKPMRDQKRDGGAAERSLSDAVIRTVKSTVEKCTELQKEVQATVEGMTSSECSMSTKTSGSGKPEGREGVLGLLLCANDILGCVSDRKHDMTLDGLER